MSITDGSGPKPICLALQGGGAHGAFTWGVLDRLLRDDRIAITAVSGASAGAMNAVVLANGLEAGGAETARRQLNRFWTGVSQDGGLASNADELIDTMCKFWHMPSTDVWGIAGEFQNLTGMLSPLGSIPIDINPLGALLEGIVDFDRLKKTKAIRLFLSATNVRTGRGRIFANRDITPKAVLASAALPHLFQPVEIDGESYWDGGFVANPPLWPFYEGEDTADIVLIQVNPEHRDTVPATAWEIVERKNEIMFNTSLIKELRSIFFVDYLLDRQILSPDNFRQKHLHRIDGTRAVARYGDASKIDTSLTFFESLKGAGERAASHWLDEHFAAIGVRSSVDLQRDFKLGPALDLVPDPRAHQNAQG